MRLKQPEFRCHTDHLSAAVHHTVDAKAQHPYIINCGDTQAVLAMSSQDAHKLGSHRIICQPRSRRPRHPAEYTHGKQDQPYAKPYSPRHLCCSMLDRCSVETHCRRTQHVTALDRKVHAIPSSPLTCKHLQEPLPLRGALASFYERSRRSAEVAKHSHWQAVPLMHYNIPQLYKL